MGSGPGEGLEKVAPFQAPEGGSSAWPPEHRPRDSPGVWVDASGPDPERGHPGWLWGAAHSGNGAVGFLW